MSATWYVFKDKKLNREGLDNIIKFEGFSSIAYWDHKGYSIGYGHLINNETESHLLTAKLTTDEALELLKKDVKGYEDAVNENVKVPLSQNMFNALVSFCYNVGIGAFKSSTLLRVLNDGDYIEASNQLERWNKASGQIHSGLVKRRNEEQKLFFS